MIGLAVLAVAAIYVAVFVFVIRNARKRAERIAAIAIAVLIPVWDLPIGYYHFRTQCVVDADVQAIKRFPAQSSLYFASFTGRQGEHFLRSGLDVAELAFSDGNVVRFSKGASGAIERKTHVVPDSLVRVKSEFNERLAWSIVRHEHRLELQSTQEVVAKAREYAWYGGWLFRLNPAASPLATCNDGSLASLIQFAVRGHGK